MALWTTGVLAGMIEIFVVTAMLVAFIQMPTHCLCPAGGNGKERPLVVVGHPVSELFQILRAMFSDNFRQLDHG
jgi:hypothetical protein